MELNRLSRQLIKLKFPFLTSIVLLPVLLFAGTPVFYRSNGGAAVNAEQFENIRHNYLSATDPILMTIKNRTIDDLKQHADPGSANNVLIAKKMGTFTKEKQAQLQKVLIQSITNYTIKTDFDIGTFMSVYDIIGGMSILEISTNYDIRVKHLGVNEYVAEFWEDGIAVNSEAHALARAQELANSAYAKEHPDDGIGDVEKIKATFAKARKLIESGKEERYTKVMALLYTLEKNGQIVFHDPFQAVVDFVRQ